MDLGLIIFATAVIGMGVVYFISKEISIPSPIDGFVAILVFSGLLLLLAAATNTDIPPESHATDDECIFETTLPGFQCLTYGQYRRQHCMENPVQCRQDEMNRVFSFLPLPYLVAAYVLGLFGGHWVHQQWRGS